MFLPSIYFLKYCAVKLYIKYLKEIPPKFDSFWF